MPKAGLDGGGRFGNQIFRYWATKILCHLYGHEYVGSNIAQLCNPIEVNDHNYRDIFDGKLDKNLDIVVTGFCQDLNLFGNVYRNIVKELMCSSNTDEIFLYKHILVGQLDASIFNPSAFVLRPNDIVIHVRLDDFINSNSIMNTNILSTTYYTQAIGERTQWDRVIIVTDVLRNSKENTYIENMKTCLGGEVIVHQGTMLEDWHLLCKARNIVVSNSTFAWTALIAGNAEFAVIPNTRFYDNQVIVPIHEIAHCVILDSVTIKHYD